MVNGHSLPLTHGLAVFGKRVRSGHAVRCLVLALVAGGLGLLGTAPLAHAANVVSVTSGTYRLENSSDGSYAYDLAAGTQLEAVSTDVRYVAGISGAGDLVVNMDAEGVFALDTQYILNGAYTYTGNTIVRSGTFQIGAAVPSTTTLIQYGGTSVIASRHTDPQTWNSYTLIADNGQVAYYEGNLIVQDGTVNFVISSTLANENYPYVQVGGLADLTDSTINVQVDGDVTLTPGSSLLLLSSDNIVYNKEPEAAITEIKTGSTIVTTTEENSLHFDYGNLYMLIGSGETKTEVAPGTKALGSSALTGLMLTLQGADLVATRGMQAAVEAAKDSEDVVFTPFATMSGSSMHYNGTAESWLSSYNLMTGFVLGRHTDLGRIVAGAFFEYGTGSYSTDNSFGTHTESGDGNAYYVGAGLLARMDFADLGDGHFYLEASGRLGGLYNAYGNDGLRDGNGVRAEYDSYAPYYGFHVGLGYIWDINEENTLELYGKYLWTRECGDSMTLSTKEKLDFDDIDSSRLRFGTRYSYTGSKYVRPYVGVAWEHEFDGVSRSTTNNVAIPQSNLRGDTGIGEIGVTVSPSKDVPFNVDFAVTGYTGKREGVSGTLLFTLAF